VLVRNPEGILCILLNKIYLLSGDVRDHGVSTQTQW